MNTYTKKPLALAALAISACLSATNAHAGQWGGPGSQLSFTGDYGTGTKGILVGPLGSLVCISPAGLGMDAAQAARAISVMMLARAANTNVNLVWHESGSTNSCGAL